MVTWAAAQESRRRCFHKRSNFETRPQPGRRVGNNKFVLGQSSTGGKNNDLGEKKKYRSIHARFGKYTRLVGN